MEYADDEMPMKPHKNNFRPSTKCGLTLTFDFVMTVCVCVCVSVTEE